MMEILSDISKQAKAAGATKVQINGHSVINDALNKFFNMASKNGGKSMGWNVSGGGQKGTNVILTKDL